jgi:hypothetical protein
MSPMKVDPRRGLASSARVRERRSPRRRWVCVRLGTAALALALISAGGRAWGQAPSAPANTLERAAALVQTRAFEQAAAILRDLLAADPTNRRAKELLAFTFESMADIEGERQVRAALAAEFPDDPRIQTDYGRVLERSGEDGGALRAYRHARELSAGGSTPELDAAIERMRGRTALEVGAPVAVMSDPDAVGSSVQAGAAVPFGSRHHMTLLGTHAAAHGRTNPGLTTASEALALSLVLRQGTGASWTVGPRLHVVSPRGATRSDVGVGGAIGGRAVFGPSFEAEGKAEVATPWDEAAVTVLRGGRTTAAEGHLYSHGFSRRLLLQVGARRRQLSILAADPQATRPKAWQSLWLAGADVVLWRKPGAAVRGEMLDETFIAPTTLSSAMTLAYRHYDVSTKTTPEFAALIGLVPRGSIDEASVATTLVPPRGHVGLELRTGLARDSDRGARVWRAGGRLIWAPVPATRFALGYEGATETAAGLVGQRRSGWLSFHVDL